MAKVIFLSVEKPLSRISMGDAYDVSLEWFLENNSDGQFLVTKKDGGYCVAKAVIEEVEEIKEPEVEKPEIKEKKDDRKDVKVVSGTGSKKPKGKGRTGTGRNK